MARRRKHRIRRMGLGLARGSQHRMAGLQPGQVFHRQKERLEQILGNRKHDKNTREIKLKGYTAQRKGMTAKPSGTQKKLGPQPSERTYSEAEGQYSEAFGHSENVWPWQA